jgi:hypothetical protein
MSESLKNAVRRLVNEVMNAGRLEVLDEFYEPRLAQVAPFHHSCPGMWMEFLDLIAEVYIFRLKRGKITQAWGIEGTLKRLEQLGLT